MKVEKQEYYSVSDWNIIDIWGSGSTEEEAISDYHNNLLKYKDKLLDKIKYIEQIEKEIKEIR